MSDRSFFWAMFGLNFFVCFLSFLSLLAHARMVMLFKKMTKSAAKVTVILEKRSTELLEKFRSIDVNK